MVLDDIVCENFIKSPRLKMLRETANGEFYDPVNTRKLRIPVNIYLCIPLDNPGRNQY